MNSWKLQLVGLGTAVILLSGCATASSDACPPIVEYGKERLDEAAKAVEALPEGSPLVEMLADYAVLRAQVRACKEH